MVKLNSKNPSNITYDAKYIKSKLNIIDLVEHLNIEIHGSKIYSIYHEESTPSLHLYEETNTFHDFSSSKSGDVIQFHMDYKKINFLTALAELTSILTELEKNKENKASDNIEIKDSYISPFSIIYPEEMAKFVVPYNTKILEEYMMSNGASSPPNSNPILDIRKNVIAKVYKELFEFLRKQNFTEDVWCYLTGPKRKLNYYSIERHICQIHNNRETVEHLKSKFSPYELLMSGLFSENGYFLFSKHPILIFDEGKFGFNYIRGRYFQNGSPEIPSNKNVSKYIGPKNNSGLMSVKRFFNSYEHYMSFNDPHYRVFVFEGEFDAILATQNRLDSLAILGVSALPKYLSVLNLFYNVYLCFDSDDAGNTAKENAASLIKKEFPDLNIFAVKFLNHKDYTEWCEKDKNLLEDPDVEVVKLYTPEKKEIVNLSDYDPIPKREIKRLIRVKQSADISPSSDSSVNTTTSPTDDSSTNDDSSLTEDSSTTEEVK